MGKVITKEDIQVGDTIRITREVKVAKINEDAFNSGGSVDNGEGGFYVLGGADIELIDRPLPPLPTTPGSVIRISTNNLDAKTNWMLGVNDMWMSPHGHQQSDERLRNMIQSNDWKFEVIA